MLIDFNKVNVYQADKLILQDVNFQADEGEFIYIIGKVGSGKSSLLKTMYCEISDVIEAPIHTRICVLNPAGLLYFSLSRPIQPPRKPAKRSLMITVTELKLSRKSIT